MEPYIKSLITGAMNGRREDVEKLLENCMHDILRMSISHSNRQEAEDIAQEVAIIVFSKINTLSDPLCFWKWLSVVVRNTSITHMRKIYKTRERVTSLDDVKQDELIVKKIDLLPEKYVEEAELRSTIKEEINTLPKKQEICMSYYCIEEYKRADIAKKMGLTPRQVSSVLYLGKKKLKKRQLHVHGVCNSII